MGLQAADTLEPNKCVRRPTSRSLPNLEALHLQNLDGVGTVRLTIGTVDIGFEAREVLADFAEHEHEVQHRAVVGREHFARHNQRNSRRIRQNHVGVDLVLHILNADFLNLTVEFALEGLKRRHDHLRQRFKRVEHHVRQIVFNDELMDALGQFLQTHAVR